MKAHLALFFALLLICTGAALAQGTPDWMTPAQETVCDSETGAAYGLCNAYCEAMDCESDSPQASATACTRVRDKYQQVTGNDVPCEVVDCPCNDPAVSAVFAAVVAGEVEIEQCSTDFPGGLLLNTSDNFAAVGTFFGSWVCGDESRPVFISPQQGQVCIDLLAQAAAAQGVTCGPTPN